MSKATAAPKPDLTAELAKDTVATPPVATEVTTPVAETVSVEEQAQLDREKAAVERMASGATVTEAVAATIQAFADQETIAERAAREFQERKQKFGTQYVVATGGRSITDPDTCKSFSPDKATKTVLTGWVEYQLANEKLAIESDD